jgi:hypothetical protein
MVISGVSRMGRVVRLPRAAESSGLENEYFNLKNYFLRSKQFKLLRPIK